MDEDNDAMSCLSESSQKKKTQTQTQSKSKTEASSPNRNQKSKIERKKKEEGKRMDSVKEVWNEHSDWLRNSGFAQPQVVESIFPQFFADISHRENLRMAQVFCLPMAAMKVMSYT
jgi:hypothetical protein